MYQPLLGCVMSDFLRYFLGQPPPQPSRLSGCQDDRLWNLPMGQAWDMTSARLSKNGQQTIKKGALQIVLSCCFPKKTGGLQNGILSMRIFNVHIAPEVSHLAPPPRPGASRPAIPSPVTWGLERDVGDVTSMQRNGDIVSRMFVTNMSFLYQAYFNMCFQTQTIYEMVEIHRKPIRPPNFERQSLRMDK